MIFPSPRTIQGCQGNLTVFMKFVETLKTPSIWSNPPQIETNIPLAIPHIIPREWARGTNMPSIKRPKIPPPSREVIVIPKEKACSIPVNSNKPTAIPKVPQKRQVPWPK